jgi:hypothetical protein
VTFDPFHVDLDGVLELSRLHADAAAAMNEATGCALAKAAGVDAAHGSIGTRVTGAFAEVLDARHGALKAASNTSGELSDRLGKAVRAYARGDESGAESVRTAAEAMDGGAPHGTSGTPVAAAATPRSGSSGTPIAADAPTPSGAVGAAESSGVADALGQAVGQVGQDAVGSGGPEQAVGVGAYAVDSDLATQPPAALAPQPPSRSTADEQAERLTRD